MIPSATRLTRVALVALSGFFVAPRLLAAPPTKAACAAAHAEAQRLRSVGDLRGARERLLVCSRDPCPKVVQDECVPWLTDVVRAMPGLVFEARTPDGRDVPDVRVLVDGQATVERLDGRPIELNPGEHVLRFEPSHGPVLEQRVLVAEGEKNRIFRITVSDADPPPPPPTVGPPRAPETGSTLPVATVVGAGIGVVALGGFGFFAATGLSAEHDLRECTPSCSASRVDAVQRRYVAADILLGVSALSFAVATYAFLTRH